MIKSFPSFTFASYNFTISLALIGGVWAIVLIGGLIASIPIVLARKLNLRLSYKNIKLMLFSWDRSFLSALYMINERALADVYYLRLLVLRAINHLSDFGFLIPMNRVKFKKDLKN